MSGFGDASRRSPSNYGRRTEFGGADRSGVADEMLQYSLDELRDELARSSLDRYQADGYRPRSPARSSLDRDLYRTPYVAPDYVPSSTTPSTMYRTKYTPGPLPGVPAPSEYIPDAAFRSPYRYREREITPYYTPPGARESAAGGTYDRETYRSPLPASPYVARSSDNIDLYGPPPRRSYGDDYSRDTMRPPSPDRFGAPRDDYHNPDYMRGRADGERFARETMGGSVLRDASPSRARPDDSFMRDTRGDSATAYRPAYSAQALAETGSIASTFAPRDRDIPLSDSTLRSDTMRSEPNGFRPAYENGSFAAVPPPPPVSAPAPAPAPTSAPTSTPAPGPPVGPSPGHVALPNAPQPEKPTKPLDIAPLSTTRPAPAPAPVATPAPAPAPASPPVALPATPAAPAPAPAPAPTPARAPSPPAPAVPPKTPAAAATPKLSVSSPAQNPSSPSGRQSPAPAEGAQPKIASQSNIAGTASAQSTAAVSAGAPVSVMPLPKSGGTDGMDPMAVMDFLHHHQDFSLNFFHPIMAAIAELTEVEAMHDLGVVTLKHAKILTGAAHVRMFLARPSEGVTVLHDIMSRDEPLGLGEPDDGRGTYYLPPLHCNKGIVGHSASTGKLINVSPLNDARYDHPTDFPAECMGKGTIAGCLCLPVFSQPPPGIPPSQWNPDKAQLLAVVQCIHFHAHQEGFSEQAQLNMMLLSSHIGVSIRDCRNYEKAARAMQNNKSLLTIAKSIFSETNTSELIATIIKHAQELLACEGCSIFLVDQERSELYVEVFENVELDQAERRRKQAQKGAEMLAGVGDSPAVEPKVEEKKQAKQIRFPIGQGIAGYVAETGETLNIVDAYKDPRFNRTFDLKTGYRTRTILCMPIQNEERILGVAQLVNKKDTNVGTGDVFTQEDEDLFMAFVAMCGIGLNNAQLLEKITLQEQRTKVALEMISYHVSASQSEVQALARSTVPPIDQKPFISDEGVNPTSLRYTPRGLNIGETHLLVLRMAMELGLIDEFHLNMEVFARFIITVQRNYRDVKFHNWAHAMSVLAFFFAICKNIGIENYLYPYEVLGMFVAALCHDIDHRGLNNSFQKLDKNPLATLYQESTMERHHFAHTMTILQQESNNILAVLPEDLYREVLDVIKHCIISTDLKLHFGNIEQFKKKLLPPNKYDKESQENRRIVMGIIMTCCDLSDISKPWPVQREVAQFVYDEFFFQGDEEKKRGQKPIAMMDRDLANIPHLQVGFIDHIAKPTYSAVVDFVTEMQPVLDGTMENRAHWEEEFEQTDNKESKRGKEPEHLPTL